MKFLTKQNYPLAPSIACPLINEFPFWTFSNNLARLLL